MKTVIGSFLLGVLPFSLAAQEVSLDESLALAKAELKFAPQPKPQELDDHQVSDVYQFKWKVDAPVIAAGTIWSLYAFTKVYDKPSSTIEEIEALDKNDINGFDRWVAGKDDDKADKTSDLLFYGSMPLPALLFIDKQMRKDALSIGLMYWETFAVTGLLYTGSTYFTNRYRPESYNTDKPSWDRLGGGYKNSFFAGHVALVGTATFFTAKVYDDYHPDSKMKWVFYGGAAAATAYTAYLRLEAGKHFPSDILVGTAVGVASGILMPHWHKRRELKEQAWRIGPSYDPYSGGTGLSFTYSFK